MDENEFQSLFFAEIIARGEALKGTRLVHYTSAEAGYAILTGRKIWLRSSLLMNDFSEIEHGLRCLHQAWRSEAAVTLKGWLETTRPGFVTRLETEFDQETVGIRTSSYVLSLSEHDVADDTYGRLSMWRAYGGKAGIALVLNTDAFRSEIQSMGVFSSPVFYHSAEDFERWFTGWVARLVAADTALKPIGDDGLLGAFRLAFRTFALCTKHPGFREEREWRVFHSPAAEAETDWVKSAIQVVRGVPQELFELSLFDDESRGVVGVGPATLLNSIIIGPCDSPIAVHGAMWKAMERAGVEDIENKIRMSNIPLRH